MTVNKLQETAYEKPWSQNRGGDLEATMLIPDERVVIALSLNK